MNEARLPEGWRIAKIGNEFRIVTGNTPLTKEPLNYGNDIPFVKPPDLLHASITKTQDYLSARGAQKSRILPENSILVSCIGNLGKVGINRLPVAFNQQINAIVVDNSNSSEWVFYYCQTQAFRNDLHSLSSATTIPIVNKSKFEGVKIPLPPLPIQNQIVTRIEELFSELDAGVQELKTALKRLKIYRQAVIDQAFDKTGKDWETARLGNLAELRGGVTKGRHLDGKETVSVPYLRVANVQDGYLDLDEIKNIEVLLSDVQKYKLMDQDILFTEGGDKDKLGRGTVWNNQIPDCIHQNHVFRARVKRELLAPVFLTYAAKTTQSRQYFYKVAKQTTNLASINIGQLSSLEIPLPDLVIQNQILLEVEAKLSEADAMEATIRQELIRAENLRQSILKRAFEGKLISQADNMVSKQMPADSLPMITNDGQLSLF